jgi:hypothetical protein
MPKHSTCYTQKSQTTRHLSYPVRSIFSVQAYSKFAATKEHCESLITTPHYLKTLIHCSSHMGNEGSNLRSSVWDLLYHWEDKRLVNDAPRPRSLQDIFLPYLANLPVEDLCNLRLTSRGLTFSLEAILPRISRCLYVTSRFSIESHDTSLIALARIGEHCRSLTIHISDPDLAFFSDIPWVERRLKTPQPPYAAILSKLPNLQRLRVCCAEDQGWQIGAIPEALLQLRLALESAYVKLLHEIVLDPIHPLGVLYFRWSPGLQDGTCLCAYFWEQITTLTVYVTNPDTPYEKARDGDSVLDYYGDEGEDDESEESVHLTYRKYSRDQTKMFYKILHSFIACLVSNLTVLKFGWVGAPGPNPFFLPKVISLKQWGWQDLKVPKVLHLRLENVDTTVYELAETFSERARVATDITITNGYIEGHTEDLEDREVSFEGELWISEKRVGGNDGSVVFKRL